MQFNHGRANFGAGPNLVEIGIDKHADARAVIAERLDRAAQRLPLTRDIEAAFRRDFFAIFRHHADEVGAHIERNIQNFLGIAHFQIQLGSDAFTQQENIGILNVAAVSS